MTTIGLSSSDRAANAKKPPRDDDDDAPRPRSLLSNRPPPRPFCPPPQKRLLFHPPTQSVFVFFKGRRRLDSNPIAPNLPLLLLLALLFALLLLLLVDAHPLIVIDERIRTLISFLRCLLRHFCFSLSLFLSQKTKHKRDDDDVLQKRGEGDVQEASYV